MNMKTKRALRRGLLCLLLFALGVATGTAGSVVLANQRAMRFIERRHVDANQHIIKRVLTRKLDLNARELEALERTLESNKPAHEALLRAHEQAMTPMRNAMFKQLRAELRPHNQSELDSLAKALQKRRANRYVPKLTFDERAP